MHREKAVETVKHRAEEAAEERILDVLLPPARGVDRSTEQSTESDSATRQVFRKRLREGQLDDKEIEVEVASIPVGVEIMTPPGMEDMNNQRLNMFPSLSSGLARKTKLPVKNACQLLTDKESSSL